MTNPEDQTIALTQTVQKGGCAAKIAASELKKILIKVKFGKKHEDLLIGGELFDDAAVYKINNDLAMVQTLDFFTPIIDTPKLFGAVAAANALSDVYAMGGKPKTVMGILAFPSNTFAEWIIVDVMQGASDKIYEAGANFVGGHSIDDDTLKFGLSVTGFVHPDKIWSNAGARPGDHLILTKPLGTGTMTAGLKRKLLSENDIEEAILSMSMLNNIIDYLNKEQLAAVHAATDITGFGFSGHSMQLANASAVSLRINTSSLPVFTKTFTCLEKEFLTKAHRTNAEYTREFITTTKLNNLQQLLLHDPQTSGGLLLSVDPTFSKEILEKIIAKFAFAKIVGTVETQSKQQNERIVFAD